MADNDIIEATLHCQDSGAIWARVTFNCRLIKFSDNVESKRALHLFRFIEGQYADEVDPASDLLLKAKGGFQARARIAAMPASRTSAGFLQIV